MKNIVEHYSFTRRHIGPNAVETQEMLNALGYKTLDELIEATVPNAIRRTDHFKIPEPLTEFEMLNKLKELSTKNKVHKNYIGLGYYNTIVPTVIQRNVLENPGWYTQYTPYQAEIAQGRLEALINFQTMVSDLTGLPIANASLLDEATAAAEAMTMVFAHSRKDKKGNVFMVSDKCFEHTVDVLKTRAEPYGIEIKVCDLDTTKIDGDVFAILIQYPDAVGSIENHEKLIKNAKKENAYIIMATDLLALCLLKSPGEMGADVAIGSAQRMGVPLGFGGPHAAFFATKDDFKRIIPGRIIGISKDAQDKPALRMALQTREQHIRREKATSNICTAQALLAIMASMYAVYHGPKGLKSIALDIHLKTKALYTALNELGFYQDHTHYFDTLKVEFTDNSGIKRDILRLEALKNRINFRYFDDLSIGISVDETTSFEDLQKIVSIFAKTLDVHKPQPDVFVIRQHIESLEETNIPKDLQRSSEYLTHPVFNSYHCEHEMLRYIKKLEKKDLSLTTSMISLGSCTMKLNATTEMYPVSFEGFNNIHPFAPMEQCKGYQQLFLELEKALCEVTNFAAISFQPNSGAQGEYAGLLVIRAYLKDIGQGHRNIVLIPSSAHGTNPASAVLAGLEVVVVKCDEMGNIDVADLRAKAEQYKDNLACLMVTYPSTHGVFEETIIEVCNIIHEFGGQVYMDGANMNAQVGLTSPGLIGADVCHLNLHKTFCIPHGGGGPGMGPIGVAKHLEPFLPSHVYSENNNPKGISAVSASAFSSASILVIPYAYIFMMGPKGLTDATKYAILNANYMKSRLEKFYKVLYQGKNGTCAHEFILDMRSYKHSAEVEVEDIAKRLMDYNYHAPTVSFPVAGTLMIEPTESESKAELDKFCDALISIYHEIQEVINGADKHENVLKHAPHTAEVVISDSWNRPYSREKASFPLAWVKENKFWPSVSRINNTYGDRNLVCTCAPIESYM